MVQTQPYNSAACFRRSLTTTLRVSDATVLQQRCVFQTQRIPECSEWRLAELDFNDFSLDTDQMMVAAVRIFLDLGLLKKLRLDTEVRC